ncbi:hypothetical protein GUJ93_ZPchr0012g22092 [Zizania palustris]|uniref:Uncharacterized protein n=1 Tax=Zizania palustris TaxID=103762 RepID=A0A8J5WNV4_ZIZPA|nr:hypothetical protein GUJ93_ZPchr0012g22092 [Zizania palustris]
MHTISTHDKAKEYERRAVPFTVSTFPSQIPPPPSLSAMTDESLDAAPEETPAASGADVGACEGATAAATASSLLRPRREAFEHGLLPIPRWCSRRAR